MGVYTVSFSRAERFLPIGRVSRFVSFFESMPCEMTLNLDRRRRLINVLMILAVEYKSIFFFINGKWRTFIHRLNYFV